MIALLLGILFLIIGALGPSLLGWWPWRHFVIVLSGSVPPILILSGLAAVALGISQVRDKMAAKKEEEELAAEEKKAEPPKPEVKPAEPEKREEPKPQAAPPPPEPEKREEAGQ